jgi:hypothetical protein
MKKIKTITGIIWAFACLILIIVLFPGLNAFSSYAAKLPFMKINPHYTGGEVATRMISDGCTLVVRKPVFDGLFGERKNGFVQVDWRGNIPLVINDTIDYDNDKVADFRIRIDKSNSKTILEPLNSRVKKIGVSTPASYGWAVRVNLSK